MKKKQPQAASEAHLPNWLDEWESKLASASYDEGLKSILPKLTFFRGRFALNGYHPVHEVQQLMLRTLKCYTIFIARASLELVKESYLDVCMAKPTLGAILSASGYAHASAGAIWKKFAHPPEGQPLNLYRALGLVALSNIHRFPGEKLTKLDPNLTVPLALGCLTQRCVVSKSQHDNLNWLLSLSDFYEKYQLSELRNSYISTAWMYCSYTDLPSKHAIKAELNSMFRRWIDERVKSLPEHRSPRPIKQKPTIAILSEYFSDHHAMFRCHGKSAMALKENFFTVLVGDLSDVSPASRRMFTKTVHVDKGTGQFKKTYKVLGKIKPDLIYYPSVGMSSTIIPLANMRIAPIQFLSMGHPASTFSQAMDYVIVNNDLRPDPSCFSEKIIHRRISAGYIPSPYWRRDLFANRQELNKDFLNVAIVSFMPKNTHTFVQLCKRIAEEVDQVDKPVKFHFFPNSNSSELFGFRAEIKRQLKFANAHPTSNYRSYMLMLHSMDLVLSTFPFGNTNGTIDTLLAGVPMIALEGPEPHSKTDARLLRKVGAPPEMLAATVEDYFQTAKAWLSDPALLASKRAEIAKLDVEGVFYDANANSDFAEVVQLIYRNHEALQADNRREFEFEDLVAMQQSGETEQTS